MSDTHADLLKNDMQASFHIHVGVDESQLLLTVEFRDADKKHLNIEIRLSTREGLQHFLRQICEQAKATMQCASLMPYLPDTFPPPAIPASLPDYD